jgi:hypothetical protein
MMFEDIVIYYEQEKNAEQPGIFLTATDKLLLDTISEQLLSRMTRILKVQNILDALEEKFKFLRSSYSEDDREALDFINKSEEELYWKILGIMKRELGIEIQSEFYEDKMEGATLKNLVNELYEFFFLNYTENLKYFFLTYLERNSKLIASAYKDELQKKDLEYITNKKELEGNHYILMKFCGRIIKDFIVNISLSPIQVMEDVFHQDPDEGNFVFLQQLIKKEVLILNDDFNDSFFLSLWNLEDRSHLSTIINEELYKKR